MNRRRAYANMEPAEQLLEAAFQGNLREVRRLLAQGVSPDVCNEHGDTPLIRATGAGNRKIVQALIAAGADLNRRNRDGLTALMFALRWDDRACVSVRPLLVAASDPEIEDNHD